MPDSFSAGAEINAEFPAEVIVLKKIRRLISAHPSSFDMTIFAAWPTRAVQRMINTDLILNITVEAQQI